MLDFDTPWSGAMGHRPEPAKVDAVKLIPAGDARTSIRHSGPSPEPSAGAESRALSRDALGFRLRIGLGLRSALILILAGMIAWGKLGAQSNPARHVLMLYIGGSFHSDNQECQCGHR